ncbi:MAG TPA: hypothetical protein VFP22_04425 [Candidatus Limnocylindrales bacterium]|nr:hypothetical protein [Candidatus Limnocylindrales bacterium]
MPRLSLAAPRRDPFWDMDGKSVRRSRNRQKAVRLLVFAIVALVAAVLLTRLPAVDPEYLVSDAGRPILAAAIFTLLGSTILLGLARLRHPASR